MAGLAPARFDSGAYTPVDGSVSFMRGYVMRRTHSLIHRGYLYAQKRVCQPLAGFFTHGEASQARMKIAKVWRDGYLQALRDAKK